MASGFERAPGKGVAVGVGVATGAGEGVALGVGVSVGASEGVTLGLGTAVGVAVAVGVRVAVAAGIGATVAAGVAGGGDRSSGAPVHATRTLAAISALASRSGVASERRLNRIGGLAPPRRGYTPP